MTSPKINTPTATEIDIKRLNHLIGGEQTAVETYSQAISACPLHRSKLFDLRDSHLKRVYLISRHIWDYGGQPDKSTELWGSFAGILPHLATTAGEPATLKLLLEGEKVGMNDYLQVSDLSPIHTRNFLHRNIIPLHQATLTAMENLLRDHT